MTIVVIIVGEMPDASLAYHGAELKAQEGPAVPEG
jgi:hypothetical protein